MSNLEQLQAEGRREFEERFSKEWWKGFGTTDDIDRQGIDGLLSFQDSLIARAFEEGRKSVKEYLLNEHIHFDKSDPWQFIDGRSYVDSLELEKFLSSN